MLFSIDGDGEVTHLHFGREGLNLHGAELYMKLYEANYYYIALAMRVQYYYVSARGVGA